MTDTTKRQIAHAVSFTLLFALLAHGYRFLSLGFSGDAALLSQVGQEAYQISLGRFLQPVYWRIRGYIAAPLTVGLFATAALAASACIVCHVLRICHPVCIALLCGLMCANETLSTSSAAYLPWMDVYALSLLLALSGVLLFRRFPCGWLLAPIAFAASLGMYQAYLPCAAVLLILALLGDLIDGQSPARVFFAGVRAVLSLLMGLLLYALLLKGVTAIMGVSASRDYNGVGRIAYITADRLPALIADAYAMPLRFLFGLGEQPVMTWHYALLPAPLNLALAALTVLLLIAVIRRMRPAAALLAAAMLAMLPLAMNFVQIISEGIVSGLMIYAIFFSAAMPLMLAGRIMPAGLPLRAVRACACALLMLVLGIDVIAANQMSVKRDLEFSATTSVITRILHAAERTPGYVPGETPVLIDGLLPSGAAAMQRPGFEDIARHQGMRYVYAAAYEDATDWYLRMVLGAGMNLLPPKSPPTPGQQAALHVMPAFPQPGFCRIEEGVLLIKFN